MRFAKSAELGFCSGERRGFLLRQGNPSSDWLGGKREVKEQEEEEKEEEEEEQRRKQSQHYCPGEETNRDRGHGVEVWQGGEGEMAEGWKTERQQALNTV